jgi:hypothetical protein
MDSTCPENVQLHPGTSVVSTAQCLKLASIAQTTIS